MNLLEKIFGWGEKAPDKLAHVSGEQKLTYRELCHGAYRLAAALDATLQDNRAPVVVLGHKEPELLIAFLGVVRSGRAYVPIDTIVPRERTDQIISTVQAKLVLTPDKVRELLTESKEAHVPSKPLKADDPYYIMFTSGSTGQPKGVIITLGCLTDFVEWMLGEHPFTETREVFLNQAPFSFDLSIMDLYLSLATGGTLVSVTREEVANPAQLFRSLTASNVTAWVSTPSFAQLCTQEPTFSEKMLPRLNRFLFCGETLAVDLSRELLTRFPNAAVWNTYGPTEATVATTSVLIDTDCIAKYPHSLPVGYQKPRTKVVVMDEKSKVLPEGEKGEIVIAGPNVALGYLNRPDLTEKNFFKYEGSRAYRTGDWGYYRDGLLFCDGRRDSQIKLHGYRIELGDIENNLRRLPEIKDAVVVPKMKDGKAEALAAFVIAANGADTTDAAGRALKKKLGQTLPSYMVPQRIVFVASFPITANGKADRKKLAEGLA